MGSDDDCGLRGSGGYHLMEVIKRFLSGGIFKRQKALLTVPRDDQDIKEKLNPILPCHVMGSGTKLCWDSQTYVHLIFFCIWFGEGGDTSWDFGEFFSVVKYL